MKQAVMKPRRDWNKLGPKLPTWFLRKLRRIDKRLVLQYFPPDYLVEGGVNSNIYPFGTWDICAKLKRSRMLHPQVVWSMTNELGWLVKPGPDTVKLIRKAIRFKRNRQMYKMERAMDQAIKEYNMDRERASRNALHKAMQKFCSIHFDRQWQNRVYLRKEMPRESVPDQVS